MRGFISYAHQNTRMFERFNKSIKRSLPAINGLEVWSDTDNLTGHAFEQRIMDQIAASDLFILLVSSDFLASDFIWDKEIPAIKQRYDNGALVLPVVLRPCQWQQVTGTCLAAPLDQRSQLTPISDWRPHDNGYDQATTQVMASICRHFGVTPNQNGVFT